MNSFSSVMANGSSLYKLVFMPLMNSRRLYVIYSLYNEKSKPLLNKS